MRRNSFLNFFKEDMHIGNIPKIVMKDIQVIDEIYDQYLESYKYFDVDSLIEVQKLLNIASSIIKMYRTAGLTDYAMGLKDYAMGLYTNYNINASIKQIQSILSHIEEAMEILIDFEDMYPGLKKAYTAFKKAYLLLKKFELSLKIAQKKAQGAGLL